MTIRNTGIGIGVAALLLVALWMLLWSPQATREASAQQIVDDACSRMENTDSYDFTASVTGAENGAPWPFTLRVEGKIAGDDYRVKLTYDAPGDNAWEEYRRIGDVGYRRTNNQGWEVVDFELQDITDALVGVGSNRMCPNTFGVTGFGSSLVAGVPTHQYGTSGWQTGDETLADTDASVQYQFWVNGAGQLVQHERQDRFVQSGEGGRAVTTMRSLTTFKDVGVENNITVPNVP